MTMLSFRVDDAEAAELRRWAQRLGLRGSDVLRQALHRQLVRLQSEVDAVTYADVPLSGAEQELADLADWGPAEDWSEWADAAR